LLDGVSGDEVNQEEDQGDDQPDYWEGVEDALEKSSQFSALSSRLRRSRIKWNLRSSPSK
jgi:hypothetical protein